MYVWWSMAEVVRDGTCAITVAADDGSGGACEGGGCGSAYSCECVVVTGVWPVTDLGLGGMWAPSYSWTLLVGCVFGIFLALGQWCFGGSCTSGWVGDCWFVMDVRGLGSDSL